LYSYHFTPYEFSYMDCHSACILLFKKSEVNWSIAKRFLENRLATWGQISPISQQTGDLEHNSYL